MRDDNSKNCESLHSKRKVFFSRKKVKNHLGNWGGIVSCIFLSMKRIVKSLLDYSGRGKTEQDLSF